MKEISFIHAADLHLDSPLIGLQHLPPKIFQRLKESTFIALRKVIDAAIHYQVDFVILAGDLFDEEDRSVRAQTRLRKELNRLCAHHISVFVIHGNHDHLAGVFSNLKMPDHVKTFGAQVEVVNHLTKGGASVDLYGFSYPKRHVLERKVLDYQKQGQADFHIGILHGNLEGSSEHGNYAPFQLKELLDREMDYWALGHIHKRTIAQENPPIVYPGNIQGRNRKEVGMKGCYLVNLTELGSKLHFVETSDIVWLDLKIDGRDMKDFHSVFQGCRKALDSVRQNQIGQLVQLTIQNTALFESQLDPNLQQDLLEALQEEESEESSFVWPISIQIEEEIQWDRNSLSLSADFFEELFAVIDGYQDQDHEQSLAPLFDHPVARRYLESLSEDEKRKLLQETENMLVQELLSL